MPSGRAAHGEMIGSETRRLATALGAAILMWGGAASAATVRRVSHSATLLTNGDLLIVGGVNEVGTILNSADMFLASRQNSIQALGATLTTARSSHTATLLPNGCVLVVGGNNAGALASAEIFNPADYTFGAPVGAQTSLTTARYNHTATLLHNGRVMICGGQNTAGTALSSCEYYIPDAGGACRSGTFSAAPSLQLARYNHTSVLLKDGKLWIAGGRNPALAPTQYTPTTERFDPALGIFQSGTPLIEGRAYHTATQMGDGKVLVLGGYNSRNKEENQGILNTAEIFDPTANSIVPAASMQTRRQDHATVLSADGEVIVGGGLGNVTTTYLPATIGGTLLTGSAISGAFSTVHPTMTVTGGTLSYDVNFLLGTPFVGRVVDGEVLLSSPAVKFTGGALYFPRGNQLVPSEGVRIPLNGVDVGCRTPLDPVDDNCGNINTTVSLGNVDDGQVIFYRLNQTPGGSLNSGTLDFAPSPLTEGIGTSNLLNTTTLNLDFQLTMPRAVLGYNLTNARIRIAAGNWAQASSFTVTLTSGTALVAGSFPIYEDVLGNTVVAMNNITFTGVEGSITWAGETSGQSFNSGLAVPITPTNPALNVLVDYVTDGVNLADQSFTVDVGTVIIRKAIFADTQHYNPKTNEWALNSSLGIAINSNPANHRFGHTGTLLPNNDAVFYGGSACANGTCSALAASSNIGSQTFSVAPTFRVNPPTASLPAVRALHTATLLPSGEILVAGGTNGPNVLNTAYTFNPDTEAFTQTATPMKVVRDLHSATLLPNGRVLLAGGFSTNALSTGSTNTAEIYYPDTRIFLETTPMRSARSNHTSLLLPDGNVFVAGGFGPNDIIISSAEVYVTTAARWDAKPDMPAGCQRALHATVQLKDGRIMLIGGVNSNGVLDTSAVFNPSAASPWGANCTTVPAMPSPLRSHTASLLFDGRVLVTGGNDGFGEVNASYIYDPASNSWSTTNPLPLLHPRFNHTATVLPNSTVLITGGNQRFGQVPLEHEFYHLNGSSWATLTGSDGARFNYGPRANHTLTLALNNRLYGIGGSDGVIGGVGVSLLTQIERGYFTAFPDLYTKDSPPSFRQSTITAVSGTPFLPGTNLTVYGDQFRGGTEASGGGASSQHSSFSYPHIVLQQIDGSGGGGSQSNGGFTVDLTTQVFLNPANFATLNGTITVALPATNASLPYGWYALRTGANNIYSNGLLVQAGPPRPTGAPSSIVGAALGNSSMSWTWSAAGMSGHDGFAVYNATTGIFLSTIPAGTPSFIQTGLASNATVSILVAGYSLSGDGSLSASPTFYTLSTAPFSLTIASVTFSELLLHWNTNGNAFSGTRYEVSQSTDGFLTAFSTPVPLLFGLTTNFTIITGLQTNTTYSFRVRAFNLADQPSAFSNVASTVTRTSVTGLTAQAISSTTIRWNWTPATPGQYRVYNTTTGALIATVASPPFDDSGLGVNTIRSVQVSAVTAAGEGPLTLPVTAYTLAATPGLLTPSYTLLETRSLTLVWDSAGNPPSTRYLIDFRVNGSSQAVFITTTTALTREFTSLEAGTAYDATITAVNGDNIGSVPLVIGTTYTYVQTPTIQFTGTTPSSISLSWIPGTLTPTAILNSTYTIYQVLYSSDAFATTVTTAIPFSSGYRATTATISGLLTSTTYTFRISARNPAFYESAFDQRSTITFNGGVAAGSLAGIIAANGQSSITGTLGNGSRILLRSPGGAFPTDTTMTISSHGAFGLCPGGGNLAFSITPAPYLQPVNSLYFTFDFTLADLAGIPPARAVLMRYEPVSNTCVPLETTYDAAGQTLTARLNHFSLFQVASLPILTDVGQARVFPNPYYAARDGFITIDRLPPNSRVRIFTLRGEQVLDQTANASGLLTWSATNGSGRSVASGIYLIHVESGGSRKILKVSVIR